MATNKRPSPPTDVKLNGVSVSGEVSTRDVGSVKISAELNDPNKDQLVRMLVQWSSDGFKTTQRPAKHTDWVKNHKRASFTMTGLKANTKYVVHLFTQDKIGARSEKFASVTFWTNRPPVAYLTYPKENTEFDEGETVLFQWDFADPDDGDKQSGFQVAYREVLNVTGTGARTLGPWTYVTKTKAPQGKDWYLRVENPVANPVFRTNKEYLWTVRVRDTFGHWSPFAISQSFFIRGVSTPPILTSPVGGIGRAIISDQSVLFKWKFQDKTPANSQKQADIRWREATADNEAAPEDEGWFMRTGDSNGPLNEMEWEIPAGSFQPGFTYEWQVRTYDKLSDHPSGWSTSGVFVASFPPGSAVVDELPLLDNPNPLAPLGCGTHRVFIQTRPIYDPIQKRYESHVLGEVKPLAKVQWSRLRDDISNALITTNGFGADCCELLGSLRSWMHEVVIYRDDDRVFEGPITRLTYTATDVEIEAKDVMAYLYRRIIRVGFNDAYARYDTTPRTPPQRDQGPSTKGGPYTITGQATVVERALQICVNALAYQDPNVLPHLTAIMYPDDTKQQHVVYDYQKSAWEEIDNLASNAGLDYVTVGRRIILWDTNRPIGRLPEMRDGDFQDPVIVTEYGMRTANYFAVTNNAGVWGDATPAPAIFKDTNGVAYKNWYEPYGPVEMTSSQYAEDEAPAASTESMNQAAKDTLVAGFRTKATRALAHRWPTPVDVRVPDNSRVSPDVNITIQQFVPGVWIPLRATMTCRNLEQWQKLDSVTVTQEKGVESVQVTMSPAPHLGQDVDAEAAAEEAG